MPESGAISSTAHGADAMVDRARSIAGSGVHTEVLHVLVGEHGVALSLHNTARRPDGRQAARRVSGHRARRRGRSNQRDRHIPLGCAWDGNVLRVSVGYCTATRRGAAVTSPSRDRIRWWDRRRRRCPKLSSAGMSRFRGYMDRLAIETSRHLAGYVSERSFWMCLRPYWPALCGCADAPDHVCSR